MVNFSRFLAERRSTPIWCRKATFSTWRAARERKTENTVERNRHRTFNIGLASQDFGKPNDLRKIEVSENHSLRNLMAWLARAQPDVVCLQELKVEQRAFPASALRDLGYRGVWLGERSWNGVCHWFHDCAGRMARIRAQEGMMQSIFTCRRSILMRNCIFAIAILVLQSGN